MPSGTQHYAPKDARTFAWRLSAFYAAMFAGFGLYQPYFPVWLQAKGLNEAQIAAVLAAGLAIRVVFTPLATQMADRGGSMSLAIVIACFASAAMMVGVALADGFVMILIAVVLLGAVWNPMVPLTDAYGMTGVARRGLDYGRIRVWGSVSFMAANIVGGALIVVIAPTQIIWLILASMVPLVAAAAMLVPDRREVRPGEAGRGFLNGRFVLVIAAFSLMQAAHAAYYSFSAIHWKATGYSGATVGFLWALAVAAEIVLFLLARRITGGWRPTTFFIIGGVLGTIRWSLLAFDPPFAVLLIAQVGHAASFALVHLGMIAYMAARLPPGAQASGQGIASVSQGTLMAAATFAAGPLYAATGAGVYWAMAAMTGLGVAVAAYARSLPPVPPR